MINLKENDIEIVLPDLPEEEIKFYKAMLRIMAKAKGNKAYKLNVLSIMTTGKPFTEVVIGDDKLVKTVDGLISAILSKLISQISSTEPEIESSNDLDDQLNDIFKEK